MNTIKWTVSLPRITAEDDLVSCVVDAESIEEAIIAAAPHLHGDKTGPRLGQKYLVHAGVEVVRISHLPLRSI